ncbi:hypothetical protein MNBD_BACTEROID01-2598 [hydrothermal vent metagenome]|uniref:Formimidoylglutamase n=1 Tax=hydrothermal vent metagenome TaxID=652676 RepID=A0A3B0U597_9ZZZZ
MDLRYYFNATDFSRLINENIKTTKNSLGNLLQKNMLRFSAGSLKDFDVAIIGVPYDEKTPNKGTAKAPDEIRKYLYTLDNINPKFKIADLGNLKITKGEKAIYYALRDIIDYLSEYGITTVLLGGGQDLSVGVAKFFKHNKYFQISTIDQAIDLKTNPQPYDSTNYISRILKENPGVFHINFMGFQHYFVSQEILSKIKGLLYNAIRLGNLRNDPAQIEPLLRDTDFLSFDIGAVRQNDAPGYYNGSPNGLYSEEACQIARYAGLSDKLSVFALFEVNPSYDQNNQTCKLAAQVIWYFLEGYTNRKNDIPGGNTYNYTQYNVEMEELETPLRFIQNPLTERWWFEIDTVDNKKIAVSCTKNDYLAASKKEIPEKWLQFIRKIDKISK